MSDERDDFWELSEITPKKSESRHGGYPSMTESVQISFGKPAADRSAAIPPRKSGGAAKPGHSDIILEYQPENSLIQNVRIRKWPTEYTFYNRFLCDAEKYYRSKCDEAPFVPFFSYMPQYNQMNIDQLRYYLYWRRQVSHGNFIKTDYSYIFLYLYELINLQSVSTPEKRLEAMCSLLIGYRDTFKSLDRYIGEWICDFCLIHRLPPPFEHLHGVEHQLMTVVNLREFYVKDKNDMRNAALTDFIVRNNTYRYEASSAYSEKTKKYFDSHLINSVVYTLEQTENIKDGEPSLFKTVISRTAFNGALCVSDTKCKIDAEYLSLDRTYRFRGMITSLVKCAENNIRAACGIKSRLSVNGLSDGTADVMKHYFAVHLPPGSISSSKQEKRDDGIRYELYEAESKGFYPKYSEQLELSSWELTKRLVEDELYADEADDGEQKQTVKEPSVSVRDTCDHSALVSSLEPYQVEILSALYRGDREQAKSVCENNGVLYDAAISDINEASYDITGDTIIENDMIIEDYAEELAAAIADRGN